MTEHEWLTSVDLGAMVYILPAQNERKWRLFAVACCQCIRHLLHDARSQNAIAVIETMAECGGRHDELVAAHQAACDALADSRPERKRHPVEDVARVIAIPTFEAKSSAQATAGWVVGVIGELAWKTAVGQNRRHQKLARQNAWRDMAVKQCALLRCIFSNPFRQVPIAGRSLLAWNDSTIPKLAQAIYEAQAFDRLPVLADALEEAGCQDEDMLNHCRRPGVHVKGCWVFDLVLGKE